MVERAMTENKKALAIQEEVVHGLLIITRATCCMCWQPGALAKTRVAIYNFYHD
jgi:hypothetical protein